MLTFAFDKHELIYDSEPIYSLGSLSLSFSVEVAHFVVPGSQLTFYAFDPIAELTHALFWVQFGKDDLGL